MLEEGGLRGTTGGMRTEQDVLNSLKIWVKDPSVRARMEIRHKLKLKNALSGFFLLVSLESVSNDQTMSLHFRSKRISFQFVLCTLKTHGQI